jgi:cytosine/uracil/thiamine/allantoin permease
MKLRKSTLTTSLKHFSAGITTPGLIGFVLFMILHFPIIYFIPAYKIQKLLEVQVVIATATLLGIMGWAVAVSFKIHLRSIIRY